MVDNYLNMSSPVLLVSILSIICHAVDSTSHEFFVASSLVDYQATVPILLRFVFDMTDGDLLNF